MARVYCEYCGAQLRENAKFCSNCGAPAPIAVEEERKEYETAHDRQTVVEGEGTYSIVLGSLGNCTKAAAGDLLEDLLGYTDEEAAELLSVIPAFAAQKLTYQQAQYVAQAMTEYGMEVSIRNGEQYVEADKQNTSSIFDDAGALLANAVAVLATLSAVNRMRDFRRYDRIDYREHMYVWHRPLPRKKPSLISRLLGIFGGRRKRPAGAGMAPRRPLQTGFAPRRPFQTGMAPRRPLQTGFAPREFRPEEKRRRFTGVRRFGNKLAGTRPFSTRPAVKRPQGRNDVPGRPPRRSSWRERLK